MVSSGCGGSADPPGDATVADVSDASSDAPRVAPDATAAAPCSLAGSGRLRVTLSIDPTLVRPLGDIWLAARCGDGDQDRSVRVLRWNQESSQTFEGLGPGAWRVYASSFVSPGAWSSRVTLGPSTTAAVPVTLQGGLPPLTVLRVGGEMPNTMVTSAAGVDFAGRDIAPPGGNAPVGRLETSVIETPDGLLLTALVRNACSRAPCANLVVQGVEVRSLDADVPTDVASLRVEAMTVTPGEIQTFRPLLLRGRRADATHAIHVALFGSITAPRSSP